MDLGDDNSLDKKILKKHFIDSAILLALFSVIVWISSLPEFPVKNLIIIVIMLYVLYIVTLEFTRKWLKKSLQNLIVSNIARSSYDVQKILNTTQSQKEMVNNGVLKVSNMKSVLENLRNSSEKINEIVEAVAKNTQQSLNLTNVEHNTIRLNIEKMYTIRQKIQIIAELILELSEFIQSITSSIGVVEDIAEQTNLLALNAAVEAARAGEHGKGFAVVAGEIRKLADESKQATTKIISLINDIQQATNSTVMATEEGTKEIEAGIKLAHDIDESIQGIIITINEVATSVNDIQNSSYAVEKSTDSAFETINAIDLKLQEAYKTSEENIQNIDELANISNSFKESVITE